MSVTAAGMSIAELAQCLDDGDVDAGWMTEEELAVVDRSLQDDVDREAWPYLSELSVSQRDVALHVTYRSLLARGLLRSTAHGVEPVGMFAMVAASRVASEATLLVAGDRPWVRVWVHRVAPGCFLQEQVSRRGYRHFVFASKRRQAERLAHLMSDGGAGADDACDERGAGPCAEYRSRSAFTAALESRAQPGDEQWVLRARRERSSVTDDDTHHLPVPEQALTVLRSNGELCAYAGWEPAGQTSAGGDGRYQLQDLSPELLVRSIEAMLDI